MGCQKIACTDVVKCVFVSSAGLFAGMGTTLNLACVPSVLASADPLPVWRVLYNRGKNIALITIATSAATALCLFRKDGDVRFAASAGLNLLVIPYTLIFMKPTNQALFALKGSKSEETATTVKKLVVEWNGLQWVRTTLGVSAFVIGLSALLCKRN